MSAQAADEIAERSIVSQTNQKAVANKYIIDASSNIKPVMLGIVVVRIRKAV